MTAIASGTNLTARIYSESGLLLSEAQNGIVVSNRYDEFQRRTNVAVVIGSTILASTGYLYDNASRLLTVTDGTNSATYSYIANSPLISQVLFQQNGATRMTTSKSYDFLNRLLAITNTPSADSAIVFNYAHNAANQRTAITNADSSRWSYAYDSLGQVTNGNKYWSDSSPVLGQQFGYLFDDIGNRKKAISGGDDLGRGKRVQTYSANALNQYTSRTVPGYVDILGSATNAATVTVNSGSTSRKSDYYRGEIAVPNSANAVWQPITNTAVQASGTNDYVTNWTGNLFIPQTPEAFTFDLDGNQTSDGRWTNTWDAENRLLTMVSHASGPSGSRQSLTFGYDSQWRRISKVVSNWTGSAWAKAYEQRFVYDNWNLLAILNENNTLQLSFRWGTDLSGSMQGAGGVGGLISVTVHTGTVAGVYFPAYDGNGNIAGLLSATDGTLAAQYEYDLFGKTMRATGPAAFTNPFRFSTKYTDDESGLNYYGYRYYNAAVGRWLSKDPIGSKPTQRSSNRFLREQANLYHFVFNKTANAYDVLGLAVNEVQVATFCRKTCGPDYTQAINSEIADFRTYLGGAPEVTGINIITILPWFRDVLASLDYALQADTAALVLSPFTGCPSKDCRGTITLCGKCVGSDVPGNIMFGFAVAAIGIPELLAALGADYAEATDDDGEADMNRISFIIHAALGIPVDEDHDVFPLGKQLFESGSDDICSILNTLPKHATSECSTCSRIGAYTRTKPFRRFPYPMGF